MKRAKTFPCATSLSMYLRRNYSLEIIVNVAIFHTILSLSALRRYKSHTYYFVNEYRTCRDSFIRIRFGNDVQ